ncbi:major strawberry allergen Fra a 1-2-like [Lycium ferocissimum]|uniref:major strawberry allergen Fra a 1-2-like n=1 Tax=Lycium ferocissimum TaxID=112874 RepID=UPI0028164997|nr:major strawberry allergen Fra a 1-2-like [Lycium ferocissimum]
MFTNSQSSVVTIFAYGTLLPIPYSRIFKASIVYSHKLIPKLMPEATERTEFVKGNGDVGSNKSVKMAITSFTDEYTSPVPPSRIFKASIVDSHNLMPKLMPQAIRKKLEKITYEVKFEQSPDGGSISKVTSTYYTEGDFKLKEEEIKAGKEKVLGMYKAVEAYLLQNPDAYA